jgi:uncharacterized secreted protein with C-terminal beta-propeller domain
VVRAKLEQAQGILDGLSIEDFKLIQDNAKKLIAMTELEQWIHAKDKDYQHQLNAFRTANEEIFRQATEKNLEGATLAYMQMTLSCVHCHKSMGAKRWPGTPVVCDRFNGNNRSARCRAVGDRQGFVRRMKRWLQT